MKRMFSVAAALATLAFASTASAQQSPEQKTYFQERVAAPSSAWEVSVASGYTQPLGALDKFTGMPSVGLQGIGFDLGVAYRMSQHWAIGVGGQYHEIYAPNAAGARGMTAGIDASYHFSPQARLDPWLGLGTGYRFLWVDHTSPKSNVLDHGFELARARAGIDLRVSPGFAIAPVVGADMNLFLWQASAGSTVAIADPRLNTFVFAGLQGRFDVGTMVGGEPAAAPPAPMPPPPPLVSMTEITSAPVAPTPPQPVSPTIFVSEELARACNLAFNDEVSAPKFEKNKADLQAADYAALDKIATCLSFGGPLEGQKLYLIGHTDPRGTEAYNMAIGAKRAGAVAAYLGKQGVDPARITQTSRGPRDATGKDEAGWQRDRRVDIILVAP